MEFENYIDPFSENAKQIAREFDDATDNDDAEQLSFLISRALSDVENEEAISRAQIYYSVGTAYSEIQRITQEKDEEFTKKQLHYLRKSIAELEYSDYRHPLYRPYVIGFVANLYTNYGNLLSNCGRMISAIEQFLQALLICPSFGMAQGNLGIVYYQYFMLIYPNSNKECFCCFAYHYLKKSVNNDDSGVYERARLQFQHYLDSYPPSYKGDELPHFSKVVYDDQNEEKYREWALKNHLFLNCLNDLPVCEFAIAADTIQLPDMIVIGDYKPVFHGLFNQIKQEYIYSRYLTYCSTVGSNNSVHIADKDTYLLNSSDYPQYSFRVESLKTAYKTLYGLLDKIAFFMNEYFDLGIQERDISFNSIWWSKKAGKGGYRYKNKLDVNSNYALKALYWINKDFHESFVDSPNPESKRISDIRNALEHKYVKIIWDLAEDMEKVSLDSLALYVTEDELTNYTMDLLKMLREVIISLALCVRIEEGKARQNNETTAIPLYLDLYDDEWKV